MDATSLERKETLAYIYISFGIRTCFAGEMEGLVRFERVGCMTLNHIDLRDRQTHCLRNVRFLEQSSGGMTSGDISPTCMYV